MESTLPHLDAMLRDVIKQFAAAAHRLRPLEEDLPRVHGMDVYGASIDASAYGGADHITYWNPHHPSRCDLEALIAQAQSDADASWNAGREYEALAHLECKEKLTRHGELGYVLLVDPKGHGIDGKLLSACTHQMFITLAQRELEQHGQIRADIFKYINDRIYNTTELAMYATATLLEIKPEGGLEWISAGHPHPAIYDFNTRKMAFVGEDGKRGFPLGMYPFASEGRVKALPYGIHRIDRLGPHRAFLLYSDGIAEGVEDEMREDMDYFYDDFARILDEHRGGGPRAIVQATIEDLRPRTRSDDISIVVAMEGVQEYW